ncbi:MAG: hypothetical protein ABL883_12035 [Terricaulis sp.]
MLEKFDAFLDALFDWCFARKRYGGRTYEDDSEVLERRGASGARLGAWLGAIVTPIGYILWGGPHNLAALLGFLGGGAVGGAALGAALFRFGPPMLGVLLSFGIIAALIGSIGLLVVFLAAVAW